MLTLIAFVVWSGYFLSVQHLVSSNNYLLEGWLNAWELEQVVSEVQDLDSLALFVVGKEYDSDVPREVKKDNIIQRENGILLLTNSSLVINPEFLADEFLGATLELAIDAMGGTAEKIPAHFTVVVNGKKAGSFFSAKRMVSYQVKIPMPVEISSLSIYYDNDLATEDEGRFLIIGSVKIGNSTIKPDSINSFVTRMENCEYRGYPSSAHEKKDYLTDLGLDKHKIQAIPFKPDGRNITLTGARAFTEWQNSHPVKSINVVTPEIHSRRSWITYKRTLPGSPEVGVIHFKPGWEETRQPQKKWLRLINRFDEIMAYCWNWISLTWFQ